MEEGIKGTEADRLAHDDADDLALLLRRQLHHVLIEEVVEALRDRLLEANRVP